MVSTLMATQKKEFPKASEALHKLPEKEKNDIEAKFRKVRLRCGCALDITGHHSSRDGRNR